MKRHLASHRDFLPAGFRRHGALLGLAAGLLLSMAPTPGLFAADGPPPLMSFQTRVLDSAGAPVNGPRDVIFRIYPSETGGGTALWTEKQSVTVKDGYISVILGQGGPVGSEPNGSLASLFTGINDTERYIEVQVADVRISPRLRLMPSAYSFVSGVALRLVDNSVTQGMLTDSSVGTAKIAVGAVNSSRIGDGSIAEVDLGTGVVSPRVLEDGSVNSAKILDGSVALVDLGGNSVNSSKIVDLSVASGDIADGAIVGAKILNGAVGSTKIADGAVSTDKIAGGAVTGSRIADGTIADGKLASSIFRSRVYKKFDTLINGQLNTGESSSFWYPVLAGYDMGHGDLAEGGGGALGGIWFYEAGGTWWVQGFMRTHNDHADPQVRVLFIQRRLVDMNETIIVR